MRMSAGVPRSAMNVHAAITSFAFTVNDPSPQSPSESPSPRASNRIIAMPSLANCLHMRAAAGQSLPSVNPWGKDSPAPNGPVRPVDDPGEGGAGATGERNAFSHEGGLSPLRERRWERTILQL